MNNPACVITLGDINVDVVFHLDKYPAEGEEAVTLSSATRLGGSACNTAAVLARLGCCSKMDGHLGTDAYGCFACTEMAAAGVDAALVHQDAVYSTGYNLIAVTPGGLRTMFGFRGSNALPFELNPIETALKKADLLHVSGYTFLQAAQADSVVDAIHAAHHLGVRVSLDPSLEGARKSRERIQTALPEVDFLLASISELLALSEKETLDEALAWLSVRYSCAAVVKLGGQGSLYQHGDKRCSMHAFSGRVVDDTTGAGDVFNAGFLSGLLNGDDPQTCLSLGNAAAYISVTSGQGIASLIHMPDPQAEMHALMACVN